MKSLLALVNTIENHPALNNSFFDLWISQKLTLNKLAIFIRNYWQVTSQFPISLALLIMNAPDSHIRAEYTNILYSEMGSGDPEQAHTTLFKNFCTDLINNSLNPDYLTMHSLQNQIPLLVETSDFIRGQIQLYGGCPAMAVGAQLALEWQAYPMISKLYEGARNYISNWPSVNKFHESCEFFHTHIGATEKKHKRESLRTVNLLLERKQSLSQIKLGFAEHLKLLESFWLGIFKAINNI